MFVYRQNRYSITLIEINCQLSLLQTTMKPVYTDPCNKTNFTSPNVKTRNYINLYKPNIVYSESKRWSPGVSIQKYFICVVREKNKAFLYTNKKVRNAHV